MTIHVGDRIEGLFSRLPFRGRVIQENAHLLWIAVDKPYHRNLPVYHKRDAVMLVDRVCSNMEIRREISTGVL